MWPRFQSLSEVSKWMGLVAAIWVQAFAGNGSAYANYSSTLKTVLRYNQVQLNYLAFAKDFGENVGILAGLVCNKVPPWIILLIAALEGFVGFGVLWLVADEAINPRPLWQMCIAICVGANSTTWFNTAVLVTCMRNFPHSRGTIVGFLKGFIGLGGAIFTQIFISLLAKDPVRLLLFLAVGPTIVCLISMGFIRPVKSTSGIRNEAEEHGRFLFIHIVCVALAVYLFAAAFLDQFVVNRLLLHILVVVMLLFLFAPVFVPGRLFVQGLLIRRALEPDIDNTLVLSADPMKEPLMNPEESLRASEEEHLIGDHREFDPTITQLTTGKTVERGLTLSPPFEREIGRIPPKEEEEEEEDAETLLAMGEGAIPKKKRPRRGEDFKLRQALVKADFWLLFFTFFCGVGSALTTNNNLGQLGQAQGYKDVTIFVSLSSIWSFLGRLGGGSLSEHYVRMYAIPRPFWMAGAQALMISAHLLFAFALRYSLYVASCIMGLCFGVLVAVMVPTASEIFGLKHFGIIYNFITIADPVASLLFSSILAGYLYDLEVMQQTSEYNYPRHDLRLLYGWKAAGNICTGAHCFKLTFLIMAGVCVVGTMLCLLLSIRVRPVYKTLYGRQDLNDASSSSLPTLQEQDLH
eukprot:c23286_g1_i1 orf=254-2155(+)